MTLFNKLKWLLGILIIFVLIVATNLIDRNNFIKVRDSAVSIYEDRLVAKGLLLDLSILFHEKELAAALSDKDFFIEKNEDVNTSIETIMLQFSTTKLTKSEEKIFAKLTDKFNNIQKAELAFVNEEFEDNSNLLQLINDVEVKLSDLSEIQLTEGALLVAQSKRALNTVELFTQLEIYLLIFLAVVIQIIILYTPKNED